MFTFNYCDNSTYIIATDANLSIEVTYIVTDYSTEAVYDIVAEMDTAEGFEPDYSLQILPWSADAFRSVEQAIKAVEFHFCRLLKDYKEGWLNL